MKFALIILLIIIVGGSVWVFTQRTEPAGEVTGAPYAAQLEESDAAPSETATPMDETSTLTEPAERDTTVTNDTNNSAMTESAPAPEVEDDSVDTTAPSEANVSTEIAATAETQGAERTFEVVGSNYMFSQSEIRVQAGDTVTINFTSDEGFHDWVVDEFNAATDQVGLGEQTSVTFVATEAGTYEYYCSVGQHRASGMVGTLIVE